MKNYLIAIVMLFALAACEKEEQTGSRTVGKITEINISEVDSYYWPYYDITELALVARIHAHQDAYKPFPNPGEDDFRVMLRVPFDERGTRLVLPEPPQELLTDITRDFPNAPAISDPQAQTVYYVEIACNVSQISNYSDILVQYQSGQDVSYSIEYIYSDRSVSITGQGANAWGNPTTYDLHLQKGWNMAVEKRDHNSHMRFLTHSMPAGIRWSRSSWI